MLYPEIPITQGQDYFLWFSIYTAPPPNNNPIDLTGCSGKWALKYKIDDDDDEAIAMYTVSDGSGGMQIPDTTTGRVKLRVFAADTRKISINVVRRIFAQALIQHSNGLVTETPLFQLKISQSIIKTIS